MKIALAPETVTFFSSSDGKTWAQDFEMKRPPELNGPPSVLRLGKNPDGVEMPYNPPPTYDYFDDLIVGRQ